MGDIILTFFIVITLGLSLIFARIFDRWLSFSFWSSALLLWFLMWSSFSLLAEIFNVKNVFGILMAPIFFFVQSLSCLMFLKNIKAGKMLLILTLLSQIPILETFGFKYQNQTMCSVNIYLDWVHNFDTEPGSYQIFSNNESAPESISVANGINLIPIFFIYLFQKIKTQSHVS